MQKYSIMTFLGGQNDYLQHLYPESRRIMLLFSSLLLYLYEFIGPLK